MTQFSKDFMSDSQFVGKLFEVIQSKLTPQEVCTLESISKNNGLSVNAICFQSQGQNAAPLIHVDKWYQHYQDGQSLDLIADSILAFARSLPSLPADTLDFLTQFSKIRSHLIFKLINYQKNKAMLASVPHQRFLDLAVICCFLLPTSSHSCASITITHQHLEHWHMSHSELFSYTHENSASQYPPVVRTLEETIDSIDIPSDEEINYDSKKLSQAMYVLTNSLSHFGASTVFYGGNTLERIARQLHHDLFLLPSSIHEFIIVPATEQNDWFGLTELIQQVNSIDLDPTEWLSDHAYYYSRKHHALFSEMPLDE